MNEPPQEVRSLATLSPEERSRALERYRILQPCTEDGVPLTHVARYQGIPLRTLQLWLAQYRRHGLAGLARRPRRDRGQPHGFSCFTNSGSYFMLQILCLSTLGIFPIVSRGNPFEGKCRKMLCVDLQVIGSPASRGLWFLIPWPHRHPLPRGRNRLEQRATQQS